MEILFANIKTSKCEIIYNIAHLLVFLRNCRISSLIVKVRRTIVIAIGIIWYYNIKRLFQKYLISRLFILKTIQSLVRI